MERLKHTLDHFIDRIVRTAIVVVIIILLALGANASYREADPLFAARTGYSDETSNVALNTLIKSYYDAYSVNDIKALSKLASPISDMEKSYIEFMSGYLDGYEIVEIFSKPGAAPGSYLVSVNVNVYFKGIENPSPGLDFFYVVSDDEGNLRIDNRYSAFNQLYEETETDPDVQALYDEFEIQEDVNLLRIRIQNEYNNLMETDTDFYSFINTDLPQAATQWAVNYHAAIEAAAAAEEAARIAAEEEAARLAQEEADRLAAEEAERIRAEEMAHAVQMITLSKVNIREAPTEDSTAVGFADPNTVVVKYTDEGEWSVIDYYGGKAYIKSEFLAPYEEPAPEQ